MKDNLHIFKVFDNTRRARQTPFRALLLGVCLFLGTPSLSQTPLPSPSTNLGREVLRQVLEEAPGLREVRLDEQLGFVTLRGIAGDLPTKRQALAVARSVPGVLDVLDLLIVRTRPRTDEDLGHELLLQLEQLGPRTSAVTIQARTGVVELSGKVESLALRTEIDDLVAQVPGVREVINNLEVDHFAELPPQKLPEDIVWRLPFDSSTVTMVRQGDTVTLRGKLLNREQVDELVETMMRQPGIRRVISELEVKNPFEKIPGLSDPRP